MYSRRADTNPTSSHIYMLTHHLSTDIGPIGYDLWALCKGYLMKISLSWSHKAWYFFSHVNSSASALSKTIVIAFSRNLNILGNPSLSPLIAVAKLATLLRSSSPPYAIPYSRGPAWKLKALHVFSQSFYIVWCMRIIMIYHDLAWSKLYSIWQSCLMLKKHIKLEEQGGMQHIAYLWHVKGDVLSVVLYAADNACCIHWNLNSIAKRVEYFLHQVRPVQWYLLVPLLPCKN